MRPEWPHGRGTTRRVFLSTLAAASIARSQEKGETFPADWRRYPDPATEFEVRRLTDPSYSSFLPPTNLRAVSRRSNALLYASDRTGNLQAFRMELRTGVSRQLTAVDELDRKSLTFLPDERAIAFFSGRSLMTANLSNLREREIYRLPGGFDRRPGFGISEDGLHGAFVQARNGRSQLVLVRLARGTPSVLVETDSDIRDPQLRPKRDSVLYRRGGNELWLVHFDGQQNRRLPTAPGGLGPACWSPDGRTILYLNYPESGKALHGLRELTPDSNADVLLAPTSQFVNFGRNSDASVFVGASGTKASPYVLLLLRVTRRELTLCEHRSSDPKETAPIFSPNSQYIFFQSDRDGKPAIYSMAVERLVEKTEGEEETGKKESR